MARRYTAPRDVAFTALDEIENALIDVAGTVAVLDDYTDFSGSADDYRSAVETVVRHLQADMTALRAAFDKAHKAIMGAPRGKGRARGEDEGTDNVVPLSRPEREGGAA